MRHKKYINFCLKLAQKSKGYYKHAAILVKGGSIIAVGINNNKSGMTKHHFYKERNLHAELDLLIKFDRDYVKGCVLYTAGITRSGNILYSCPCERCQKLIKLYGLKKVYYSDKNGEPKLLVV